MFIVEVSPTGKELLSRSISGYSIVKNLLVYLMGDAGLLPGHIKRQPPKGALAHVKIDKGEPHLSHMLTPKMAWKTAQQLRLVALGTTPGNKQNTTRVFGMNFLRKSQPFFLLNLGKGVTKHEILPDTISRFDLHHGDHPFCVSLREDENLLGQKLNQWLGKDTIESKIEHKIPLCLGLYPNAAFSKGEEAAILSRKGTQVWERPGKAPDIRDKPAPLPAPKKPTRPTTTHSGGRTDIRDDVKPQPANPNQSSAQHEKKTTSQTKSEASSNSFSNELESNRRPQTPQQPLKSAGDGTTNKLEPSLGRDILPTRTEGSSGEVTLVFTNEQCRRIISQSTGKSAPTLSMNFSVEYKSTWRIVTFALSEPASGRETFTFEVQKANFVESEVPWGTGGVGSPNVKKKSHGLNPRFFKILVEYAHSMIADELRDD